MRLINEIKLDFQDVLITPKRSSLSSRKEVDLIRHFKFKNSGRIDDICPIVASNMDGVGTFEMASVLYEYGCIATLSKHYKIKDYVDYIYKNASTAIFPFIPTFGISTQDFKNIVDLKKEIPYIPFIHIDVANGYMQRFIDFCKKVSDEINHTSTIIAGSVVTPEMAEELILNAGVDIVKVGIGGGAVCTTRIKTGIGYPQLSAVIETADAAHGVGGFVMSDGGCVYPGDIVKAFAGGADFVMLGTMLAGHDEGGMETLEMNVNGTKKYSKFYGMSSSAAMNKHQGGVSDYKTSEGRIIAIPHKGKVADTMKDILGGLRSACTYCGARKIKELPKRATFIRVNRQLNESVKHLEVDSKYGN